MPALVDGLSESYCSGGSSAGYHSAYFSTNSTSYSKECGKVRGYQKGTMDVFYPFAELCKCMERLTDTHQILCTSPLLDKIYVNEVYSITM